MAATAATILKELHYELRSIMNHDEAVELCDRYQHALDYAPGMGSLPYEEYKSLGLMFCDLKEHSESVSCIQSCWEKIEQSLKIVEAQEAAVGNPTCYEYERQCEEWLDARHSVDALKSIYERVLAGWYTSQALGIALSFEWSSELASNTCGALKGLVTSEITPYREKMLPVIYDAIVVQSRLWRILRFPETHDDWMTALEDVNGALTQIFT